MSSSKFAATHIVRHSGRSWDVMLVDGAAYTQAEWDSESQADYEVNDQGEWLFQGQPFFGEVVGVNQQIVDAVTATFELAVQDADGAWELLGDYPTKEAAEKAAKECAATGQYHADDSGVVVFGISADPDSGHYEDTLSVEVGIEK